MWIDKSLLFVAAVLIPLCFGAGQNIIYGNLAATLIPRSPNPTLGLAPLNTNDPNQQWITTGGAISSANPAYLQYVWDVSGSSKASGTKVILYPKKTGNNPNQQFTVQANGVITSALATNFNAASDGTSSIFLTYANPPAQATIQPALVGSLVCSSLGDPHISPYPGGRNDIFSPGSQVPGTYTLSKTGVLGDPDYVVIQADQQLCIPTTPGVYCNKRGIIKTQGQIIEVKGDVVTVNGVVVSVTGTRSVAPGLNITKLGTNNYVVNYPTGQVQFTTYSYYTNIYVTTSSGRLPAGGVCSKNLGANQQLVRKRAPGVVTPYQFCLSWRAPNISDDLFNYSSVLAWRAANPLNFTTSDGNFTTTNQTLFDNAHAYCSPLAQGSPLANQCGNFVPAASAYQACLDDVIATGDYSFSAAIIDGFSHKCSKTAGANVTIALPTSGINSIASGPGLATTVSQSSTAVSFDITARDINGKIHTTGGDNFVVSFSASVDYNQTYLGNGVYRVFYTPSVSGAITISVQLNGFAPIQNSPFKVNVESTATDPSASTASGLGVAPRPSSIPSGALVGFVITARTSSGAPRTIGGDVVKVDISGYAFVNTPIDNHNGTYTVTYEQDAAEVEFTVDVKLNNVEISGSPFTVYVTGDKK